MVISTSNFNWFDDSTARFCMLCDEVYKNTSFLYDFYVIHSLKELDFFLPFIRDILSHVTDFLLNITPLCTQFEH